MMLWNSFGASVIGPGHIASGKSNQDAWLSFHQVWGDGIIVADGLGSKPFSDFGSHAACLAVARAVQSCCAIAEMNHAFLSDQIKSKWLSLIMPLDARDCASTCVFAFRINDGMVHLGMLGDGLAAVVKTDGSVATLSDNKSEGFSSITAALSAELGAEDWRWLSFPESDCRSIILCTDGITDDLADVEGFIKGFVEAHLSLSSASAARRTREMLEKWPTQKHSDDKTIACLFREVAVPDA